MLCKIMLWYTSRLSYGLAVSQEFALIPAALETFHRRIGDQEPISVSVSLLCVSGLNTCL